MLQNLLGAQCFHSSPSQKLVIDDVSLSSELCSTDLYSEFDPVFSPRHSILLKPNMNLDSFHNIKKTVSNSKIIRESKASLKNEPEDHLYLTREITEKIMELKVTCCGDWKKITSKISKIHGTKFSQQALKTAYNSQISRKKVKCLFTKEEDDKILGCVKEFSMDWQFISQTFFQGICPLALRNRYYKLSQKDRSYGRSVKAKIVKKNKEGIFVKKEEEEYDMKTLVKDIKFKEIPKWLAAYETIKKNY